MLRTNRRRQAVPPTGWAESFTGQPADIYSYPQNLPNALALIRQALSGETEDRMKYEWLIANAPSEEDRRIIASIRDDEMRHFQMFRRLYTELTGQAPPEVMQEPFVPPGSYCEGLQQAVLGEQGAVQRYRQILYAMQSRVHINVVTDILTDELRHGILYNYLYAKNGCQA